MDPEIRELIYSLCDGGLTNEEIVNELMRRGVRLPHGSNRTSIVRRAIRDRETRRLVSLGMTRKQVAEKFGVNIKTVDRAFSESSKPANKPYSQQELQRVYVLAEEGMPMTFIAEDIGRNSVHLRDRFDVSAHRPKDAVIEWKRTWSAIRSNPVLLELHREFHPKKENV